MYKHLIGVDIVFEDDNVKYGAQVHGTNHSHRKNKNMAITLTNMGRIAVTVCSIHVAMTMEALLKLLSECATNPCDNRRNKDTLRRIVNIVSL